MWDERDRAFFKAANACLGKPRDLDLYATLFRQKGTLLSGDVTPNYSIIGDAVVERVARRFPALKVVVLLRDPVDRAFSHLNMMYRNGELARDAFDNLDVFRSALDAHSATALSLGSRTVARWRRHIGQGRLGVFFFDDLQSRPQALLGDIIAFLGADPAKADRGLSPETNLKAGKEKSAFSAEIIRFLEAHFEEELESAARMFGGHAEQWAARHRKALAEV